MSELRFETVPALTRQELLFKSIYQSFGEQFAAPGDLQSSMEELTRIDAVFSDEVLSEAHFIPENYDISLIRHNRYVPAILHAHNFLEVIYVLHGTCINHIGSRFITLHPGDLCIIGCHTRHAVSAFSDDCIAWNLMLRSSTFEETFCHLLPRQDLLSSFLLDSIQNKQRPPYLLFPTNQDVRVLQCFQEIYAEYQQQGKYSRYILNTKVSSFFLEILRHYGALAVIPDPVKSDHFNYDCASILYYIQKHEDTITLKKLAELFHYSERHLRRLLQETTGQSFSELLKKTRLDHAAELLTTTDLPISTISETVGYHDQGFFYRTFKSVYGATPSAFRQKKRSRDIL